MDGFIDKEREREGDRERERQRKRQREREREEEEKTNKSHQLHCFSASEFAVTLDVAIGSAVGLVLLGAVVAIVPMFCFMYCQRKQQATATKSNGFSNQGFSN